jgi:hypothetical protein
VVGKKMFKVIVCGGACVCRHNCAGTFAVRAVVTFCVTRSERHLSDGYFSDDRSVGRA